MSECNWNPNKHGGKPCPVHGANGNPGTGGHKIRINNGKYEMKLSDDSDWEEISSEEYNDLREGGYQDFDETTDDDFGFDEDDDALDYDESVIEADLIDFFGNEDEISTDNFDKEEFIEFIKEKNSDENLDVSEYANEVEEYLKNRRKEDNNSKLEETLVEEKAEEVKTESSHKNLMNPNNPKYKNKYSNSITNAKELYDGGTIHNFETGEDERLSVIEYIPYINLFTGSKKKRYGVVTNYDGSDAPDIDVEWMDDDLASAKRYLEREQERRQRRYGK